MQTLDIAASRVAFTRATVYATNTLFFPSHHDIAAAA